MICYELTLAGPVPFEVRVSIKRNATPRVDVFGFGEHSRESSDQAEKLRAKLMHALQAAGIPLPGLCRVEGPGRRVYSPGMPLALLVHISDLVTSDDKPRLAWGDLDHGVALPAAGELAVGLALAKTSKGPVEFVVPRDRLDAGLAVSALGELPIRVMPTAMLGRDIYHGCDRAFRAQIITSAEALNPPEIEVGEDPPPMVKLAIEVGIAGRYPTTLVGHESALGDWQNYARAITPALPRAAALERAALLSLWGQNEFHDFWYPTIPQISPDTPEADVGGNLDVTDTTQWVLGTGAMVRAHQGILLIQQAEKVLATPLGRISAGALRWMGCELRPEYTAISSMRPCMCNPPRGFKCRCSISCAAYNARNRRHVTDHLHTVVWADVARQLDAQRDFSPAAVRERITQAWEVQEYQREHPTAVRTVLGNLSDTNSGHPRDEPIRAEHQQLAELLRERPW